MTRSFELSLGIFVLCAAGCGGSSATTTPEPGPASTEPEAIEIETLAADESTGDEVAIADPSPDPDPCVDGDVCPDTVAAEGELAIDAAIRPGSWVPGAHLLVLGYAPLHDTASATSGVVTSIAPDGGVPRDSLHAWGQPKGTLSPGQTAVLASQFPRNGFWEVTYGGARGWVLAGKVTLANGAMNPVDYALQPKIRNAFFKHQIHRNLWNKDGPASSGNCAPTSLAMALHVFSREPTGESVEESIHRVRLSYGVHTDAGPTSRLEIHDAAIKLGLKVQDLATDVSPSAALTRLAGQLAKKRAVVLQGLPGAPGSTPTLYQRAMDRAFAAAIKRGVTLHNSTYTFDGYHSIMVLGRDAAGDYVVGDPLSEVGFVALTPAEMKDFMTRWVGNRGTGTAVWR